MFSGILHMIPQFLLGFAVVWPLYSAMTLVINLRRAKSMDIPLIVMPVSQMNVLWLLIEPLVFWALDFIPFWFDNFKRYGPRGWYFQDKATSHMELGDAFAIVTPREVFLHISDPIAVNDIFARRQDFIRPVELYKMLNIFGPNIATVQQKEWQRHRKIVAAPFKESTNTFVWSESLSQAGVIMQEWTRCGPSGTVNIGIDTRTLSLNVLAAVVLRKSYKFRTSTERDPEDTLSYRESLKLVLDNVILMMLLPPKLWTIPFLPKSWARVGNATIDLRQYMVDTLNEELRLLDAGKHGTEAFMSLFLRASEFEQKKKAQSKINQASGFTVSEILGNIFFINFAGHDTVANNLAYSILLLAAYPDFQDWVGEELQEVLKDSTCDSWRYEQIFPRLKRCLAVQLETLRLYPPITALPKYTDQRSQMLNVGRKVILVDSNTIVVPSILAIHTHPRFWGPDPLVWRPSRWISSSDTKGSDLSLGAQLEREELLVPGKGTYIPWSEGLQNCPAKKFSQVEFVAVIACLLQKHRTRPFCAEGEDLESARKRILAICEDSTHGLVLHMRNAENARLIWTRL